MSVFIVSGSNAPETTQVVMGFYKKSDGEHKHFMIDITAVEDPAKKAIYNEFFNFVGSYTTVELINSPYQLDCNHVTPNTVELDSIVIDYTTLSVKEKAKIDAAFAVLETV